MGCCIKKTRTKEIPHNNRQTEALFQKVSIAANISDKYADGSGVQFIRTVPPRRSTVSGPEVSKTNVQVNSFVAAPRGEGNLSSFRSNTRFGSISPRSAFDIQR